MQFPLGAQHIMGWTDTVTSLPASPGNGTVVFYEADATNGVVWQFRYDETADDWHFVGGPPLWAEVEAQETTSNTSYDVLATAGPSITLPLAGDYMVGIGARLWHTANNAWAKMSYDIGATAASDNDRVEGGFVAGTNTSAHHNYRERRKTGLGAVTLTAKYAEGTATASNATFSHRFIRALPIRVG